MRADHGRAEAQIQAMRQDLGAEWTDQVQALQADRSRHDAERRASQAQMHRVVAELTDEQQALEQARLSEQSLQSRLTAARRARDHAEACAEDRRHEVQDEEHAKALLKT